MELRGELTPTQLHLYQNMNFNLHKTLRNEMKNGGNRDWLTESLRGGRREEAGECPQSGTARQGTQISSVWTGCWDHGLSGTSPPLQRKRWRRWRSHTHDRRRESDAGNNALLHSPLQSVWVEIWHTKVTIWWDILNVSSLLKYIYSVWTHHIVEMLPFVHCIVFLRSSVQLLKTKLSTH